MYHQKEKLVNNIDSRINVSNVLAEISFIIDEKIILRKMELISEKFVSERDDEQSRQSSTVVRIAGSNFVNEIEPPLGNVRFKVVISGIAANASDVASLICKLEDSPYFCKVAPSYTRSAELETKSNVSIRSRKDFAAELLKNKESNMESKEKIMVSEFEISCYLANYLEI